MKYLSKYEIAFKGLKEGVHQFEYELDDKFLICSNNRPEEWLVSSGRSTKQSALIFDSYKDS